MSFLSGFTSLASTLSPVASVLGKIGHGLQVGLGIEQQVEPIINLIPGGSIVTTVAHDIIAVENLLPISGLGQPKSNLVVAKAAALVPGIATDRVQSAIDKIVAGFNELAEAAMEARQQSNEQTNTVTTTSTKTTTTSSASK